jgi:dihydrolipoamide dehydrogenase
MNTQTHFDCIVIGAGPGGYVAAIRAAQLGLRCAVIEREAAGGVCLNWGCIPTKALLKSAELLNTMKHANDFGLKAENVSFDFTSVMQRSRGVVDKMTKGVQFLLKKNKVELIMGAATIAPGKKIQVKDAHGNALEFTYGKLIIATGARARTFPSIPVDNERIITYRKALDMKEVPKKLLVIGSGAIGTEFAYFYKSMGSDVTIVEGLPQMLPIEDQDISAALQKSFTKMGITVKTGTSADKVERVGESVKAYLKTASGIEEWQGDYCLVAVGVVGNVENLGLESVGVKTEKSFIPVDAYYQTNVPDIYAIGDINGAPWLAHVASHEGIIAAEHIANYPTHPMDYGNIPGCTYCQPQVASIGMTEKKALEAGKKIKVGKFPFSASGKAVATNETEGFVKVVIDQELEEILGVHIIHPEATELIGEASIIRSHEGTATSVFSTVHAHPTLSEAIMEAMGDALGRAIHI